MARLARRLALSESCGGHSGRKALVPAWFNSGSHPKPKAFLDSRPQPWQLSHAHVEPIGTITCLPYPLTRLRLTCDGRLIVSPQVFTS